MKLLINSVLTIKDVSEAILKQIKAELTMRNPDYDKRRRMGLNRYAWGNEFIKLWSERSINDVVEYILPRGYYARLWDLTKGDMQITDARQLLSEVIFPDKPTLRDYQAPAVSKAKDWQQGVPVMPCGAGKTETAMGIIAELKQPTLWITHTMDLLNQSLERAKTRLGLYGTQIGIIQGGTMTIGSHITFATVQTLSKRDLSEVSKLFGCIVIDECHLCFKDGAKARMFESVISQLPAFYRFGVTASEHRSDGLISTMFHVIGPKFYEVTQADLNEAGNVVVPRVEFEETEFEYDPGTDEDGEKEMLNVAKMVAEMREDSHRNNLVLNIIVQDIAENDFCLVLGDSLDHLSMMHQFTLYQRRTAAFVCGDTPKKVREQIMSDMRAGKYQYLFATYQLAKLGLDIPRLNKLILATPKRDKTSIQQAVGRIMRPCEGKGTPVVYDIYDSKVPQLQNWARDRVKVYRSLGAEIVGGPKVRRSK